jgi:hypothetical protein
MEYCAEQKGITNYAEASRGGRNRRWARRGVHIVDANDEATAAEFNGGDNDFTVAAATVGIICVGAALIEAAH